MAKLADAIKTFSMSIIIGSSLSETGTEGTFHNLLNQIEIKQEPLEGVLKDCRCRFKSCPPAEKKGKEMITYSLLNKVDVEMQRYRLAKEALMEHFNAIKKSHVDLRIGRGCKESAALKRVSLDLSRALTQLRSPERE